MTIQVSRTLSLTSMLLAISFLTAFLIQGPASGYELSVYDSLGTATWGMGIGSLICALSAIALQPEAFQNGRRRYLIAISVLLTCLVMVALPFARGYGSLGRHDELTHIGIVGEIIQDGSLWAEDFYPAIHIETAALHLFVDVDLYSSPLALMPVYALTFVLAAYSLSRCLFKDRPTNYMVLALASVPLALMTPLFFVPNEASFALIPFVLYALMRVIKGGHHLAWMIVLCTSLIASVLYHPQLCIVLSAAVLLVPFSHWLVERKIVRTLLPERRKKSSFLMPSVFSVSILWICYFTWLSKFPLFSESAYRLVRSLIYGFDESPSMASAGYALSRLSTAEATVLIMNSYGKYILIVLAAVMFLVLTKSSTLPPSLRWPRMYLSVSLFVYMIVSVLLFFGNFILPYQRVFVLVLLFSQLLFVMASRVYSAPSERGKKTRINPILRKVLVVLIISAFVALSVSSFYQSPRVGQYNLQVTRSSFDGYEWFIDHKDENVTVMVILGLFYRYLDAELGPTESRTRPDALWYVADASPPSHFGYDTNASLGSQYLVDRYLCYDVAVVDYYDEVFPTQGSFRTSDFDALNRDSSTSRIMDNGCMVCYFVAHS